MALINCPECGKEISDSTKICPHCGYKLKNKSDSKKWIIPVIIISIVVIIALIVTAVALTGKKESNKNDTQSTISSTVQETTADKSVSLNDNSEFQEKLKSESEKSIKDMQDKYTELSNDIGGTYKGYKKNAEKVNEWYSFCESEAKSYYVTVSQYCYSYYKNVADN